MYYKLCRLIVSIIFVEASFKARFRFFPGFLLVQEWEERGKKLKTFHLHLSFFQGNILKYISFHTGFSWWILLIHPEQFAEHRNQPVSDQELYNEVDVLTLGTSHVIAGRLMKIITKNLWHFVSVSNRFSMLCIFWLETE